MTQHHYKIYYEYNGPTKGDPFRSPKKPEEIGFALERVSVELAMYLEDENAEVSAVSESASSIILTIVTSEPEESFLNALKRCLNGLDLFGTRLD